MNFSVSCCFCAFRLKPVSLALCLIAVVTLSVTTPVAAQGSRGLEGKELKRVSALRSKTGNLRGALPGRPNKLRGSLDRVVVVQDMGQKLVLDVYYTGYGGAFLRGEVQQRQGGERHSVEEIRAEPVALKSGEGPARIVFELDKHVFKSESRSSSFLMMTVVEDERRQSGVHYSYVLRKTWRAEPVDEASKHLVRLGGDQPSRLGSVEGRLRPRLGLTAAQLQDLASVGKTLRNEFKDPFVTARAEPVDEASKHLVRLGGDQPSRLGSVEGRLQRSQRNQWTTMAVQLQHVASGLYIEDQGGQLRLTSNPDENATFILRHSAPSVALAKHAYFGNLQTYDGEHYVAFLESGKADCMSGRIVTNATANNEATSFSILRDKQKSSQLRKGNQVHWTAGPGSLIAYRRVIFSPVWQGTWDTNHGRLRLQQRGNEVRGDYEMDPSSRTLQSTFKGPRPFSGTYNPEQQTLEFRIGFDGQTITGVVELRVNDNKFEGRMVFDWKSDERDKSDWKGGVRTRHIGCDSCGEVELGTNWEGARANPARPELQAARPFSGAASGSHLEGATAYSVPFTCLEEPGSMRDQSIRLKASPLTPPSMVVDREAQGPSRRMVNLEQALDFEIPRELRRAHDDFSVLSHVLNLSPEIYPDVNPASGVYYFAPYAYHMAWDGEEGFGMGTLYGASGEAGMYTYLQPGIRPGSAEMELAEQLVQLYALENELPFTALRPLPVAGSSAENLAEAVRLQNIERIVVKELDGPLDRVRLEWISDALDAQQIKQRMTRDAISGQITLSIREGELESLPVNALLDPNDPRTYGKPTYSPDQTAAGGSSPTRLSRNGGRFNWTNSLPYPVTLKFLNVLMGDFKVYPWHLNGQRVEQGQVAQIDAEVIPNWVLENGFFWVDYSVEACEACDDAVFESFASALTQRKQVDIVLESFGVLEALEARRMTVQVRSRYTGPSTTLEEPVVFGAPVTFNADDEVHGVGPLYVPATTNNPGVLFEYRITLTMDDGRPLESDVWIPVRRLEEGIGTHQACQAFKGELSACEGE